MNAEEDRQRFKNDPKFQKLAALLQQEDADTIERLVAHVRDMPELSPPPPKQGKRFMAERDKISVTIDSSLMDLVEETAAGLGVPVSRVVESAVWKYFDKPSLSFQKRSGEGPLTYRQTARKSSADQNTKGESHAEEGQENRSTRCQA